MAFENKLPLVNYENSKNANKDDYKLCIKR